MAEGPVPDEGKGDANLQAKLKQKLKPKLKPKCLDWMTYATYGGSDHGGALDAAVAPIAEAVDSREIPRRTDKGKATAAPAVDCVEIPFEKGEVVSCSTTRGDDHRNAVIVDWRESDEPGMIKYYVHYTGYDKRLDEWVPWIRVEKLTPKVSEEDFSSPSKPPSGTPVPPAEVGPGTADSTVTPTRRMSSRLRRLFGETGVTPEGTGNMAALEQSSEKEDEKETRVKNIQVVWLGKYEIHTWYHSPYPEDCQQTRLYICEFCLKYMKKKRTIDNHKCAPKLPPGDEIFKTTAPIDGQVGESEGTDLESTPPTSGTRSMSSGSVQHLSMYEVDGSRNKLYCQEACNLLVMLPGNVHPVNVRSWNDFIGCSVQTIVEELSIEHAIAGNLCLLSGLFLEHKELYYGVDSFLFYILTENDAFGKHLVGYFSKLKDRSEGTIPTRRGSHVDKARLPADMAGVKMWLSMLKTVNTLMSLNEPLLFQQEKDSDENLNVACILTLPPFQRKGYGKFLIAFAYALSKKEGKVGTPERPLSDLGKASFSSYWKRVLLETIRNHRDATIEDLSKWTSIRSDDIISTLKPLNLVKFWKHEYVPNFDKRIIDKFFKNQKSQPDWLKIDMDKVNWPFVPPDVLHTPKQRRTLWPYGPLTRRSP